VIGVSRRLTARLPVSVWLAAAGVGIGLIAVSQSQLYYIDEGIHLIAASLVKAGRRPYVGFLHQHPPLFPYLYAGWMAVAGETWRSVHLLSALLTAATVVLAADFSASRFPAHRAAAGVLTVVLVGLMSRMFVQGTVGHPYALGLCLSMIAFRCATTRRRAHAAAWPFLSGLAAGGAVLSSLLVVPIVPILAVWWARRDGERPRWVGAAWFATGAGAALLAFVWLVVPDPRPAWFDLVAYHLFYRGPEYRPPSLFALVEGAKRLVWWVITPEHALRVVLAGIGAAWAFWRRSSSDARLRAELALAAALAAGFALFAALPYPTFGYYFIFVVPFLGLVGCAGALAITNLAARLVPRGNLVAGGVIVVAAVLFLRAMDGYRPFLRGPFWSLLETVAVDLDRVVPRDAPIYLSESYLAAKLYFVARRLPPERTENVYAAGLELPPSTASNLHIVPQSTIDEWVRSGRFALVCLFGSPDRIDRLTSRIDELELHTVYGAHLQRDLPRNLIAALFWNPRRLDEARRE
jgi:hypothetical protein